MNRYVKGFIIVLFNLILTYIVFIVLTLRVDTLRYVAPKEYSYEEKVEYYLNLKTKYYIPNYKTIEYDGDIISMHLVLHPVETLGGVNDDGIVYTFSTTARGKYNLKLACTTGSGISTITMNGIDKVGSNEYNDFLAFTF